MKNFKNKAKLTGKIFVESFITQAYQPITIISAAGLGIYNGVKLNNFATGVKAGAVVVGILGVTNGISNVIINRKAIKEA